MHVITLLLILRIYFDHQLCLLFSNIYGNQTVKTRVNNRPIALCTVKLFIQLVYNKNDHLAKWSIFCQIFDVIFCLYNPFPPLDPRHPLHVLYICIATLNCPKGILGLGGKASKNKLKDANFIFSMTNVTILSIFRTHAQKEYRPILKTLGQFENLGFVIVSTRENIRLIARAPYILLFDKAFVAW